MSFEEKSTYVMNVVIDNRKLGGDKLKVDMIFEVRNNEN